MQKLIRILRRHGGEKGSILVGAVAFSIVLAIGSLGLIMLNRSMISNEAAMLAAAKARYAVESGLQLGERWLRGVNPNNLNNQSGSHFSDFSVNGYPVTVTQNSVSGSNRVQISATTVNTIPEMGCKKSMSVDASSTFNVYAHLYGREHPDNNNPALNDDWGGWGQSNTWEGRLHMNDRIKLAGSWQDGGGVWHANQYFFRNGLVTVSRGLHDQNAADMNYTTNYMNAASPAQANLPNQNGIYNNFDHGVQIFCDYGNSFRYSNLVNCFQDRFLSDQPTVSLPTNMNAQVGKLDGTGNVITSNLVANGGNIYDLPVSSSSNTPGGHTLGEAYNNYRPTLEFTGNSNTVTYRWWNGTAFRAQNFDYSGRVFVSHTHINVHGVVNFRTAVVTTNNNSIAVVDDGLNGNRGNSTPGLVCKGYQYVNGKASINNNNECIGLISGKDIVFNPTWLETPSSLTGNEVDLRIHDYTTNGYDDYLTLTAAMISTQSATSCVRWDIMSARTTPSFDANTNQNPNNYYRLRFFGSHVESTYRAYAQGNVGSMAGNQHLYDPRLKKDVTYPNQQVALTQNNLLVFEYTNYTETNTP